MCADRIDSAVTSLLNYYRNASKTGNHTNYNISGNKGAVAVGNSNMSLTNWIWTFDWSVIYLNAAVGIILVGICTQRTESGAGSNAVSGVFGKILSALWGLL